jgi:hypothetical protein
MNILDPLQAPGLRSLRFGFYRLVYIRPTQVCPARCRHCSARAEPGLGDTPSLERLAPWVQSVLAVPGVEWIGIEGGEPFAALPQLRFVLRAARDRGVSTSVVTNAYWAADERRAGKTLDALPRIQLLIVSADEFHEEFIPLRRIVHLLRAARGRVDRLAVQTCVGPGYAQFLERFRGEAGEELWEGLEMIEAPLAYLGRAKDDGIMEAPRASKEYPDAPCLFLGTPVMREDGVFVACCQQEVVLDRRPAFYHLGSLTEKTAAEFKAFVDADVFFQTLRVFGPGAVAAAAERHDWGWTPRTYQQDNPCDLCQDLTAHPRVIEGFRKASDTPEYRNRLALIRSVLYEEPFRPFRETVSFR